MKQKSSKRSKQHWTAKDVESFRYFVAADFVDQLQTCAENQGIKQKDLAQILDKSEGRVSQVFNDPGNLTLDTMITWGRAIGLKAAIVLYDDGDRSNRRGPLSGGIFTQCWKMVGSPNYWPESIADASTESGHSLSLPSQGQPLASKFEGMEGFFVLHNLGEAA